MAYKLSVLDQSPVAEGELPSDALKQTVHFAKQAEEWGYYRFWVAEHHHHDQLAGSSPEILAAYLLARTNRIKIGTGGVMLQHYSPFKVAENFHVLSSLEPGRVDLGIGKGPGGLPLAAKALHYSEQPIEERKGFEEKLRFLTELLENQVDAESAFHLLSATPLPEQKPDRFLLGASMESALFAAKYEWNFVFAAFLNPNEGLLQEAAHLYRSLYPKGRFLAAVTVIAASTEEQAKQLAGEQKIFKVHLDSGTTVTVGTREQAEAYGESAKEGYHVTEHKPEVICGTSEQVKAALDHLHERFGIDEFICHTPVRQAADRFLSFKLISPEYRASEKEGEEHAI